MPETTQPRRVLLLGDPVGHSLSGAMHNAAFTAASIDAIYESHRVPPSALPTCIAGLRTDLQILGANVTVPHKESVVALLDRLAGGAAAVRAVNTISRDGQRLVGWNTDIAGFARALTDAGYDARGKSALVLGAGGAARAVVAALRDSVERLWVASRRAERASKLCDEMGIPAGGAVPIDALGQVMAQTELLVNATPVGLDGSSMPISGDWLRSDLFVFDVLYHPAESPLLRAAQSKGARTSNGMVMLLHQGMAAFEIWTGRAAPEADMRAALQRAALEAARR